MPIPQVLEPALKAVGLIVENAPIMVKGLNGLVEIVKVGQQIPGVGVVHKIIKNEAENIISAHITHWGVTAGHAASEVLTFTSTTVGVVVAAPALVGAAAVVAVAGTTLYYRNEIADAIKNAIGFGEQNINDIGQQNNEAETLPPEQDITGDNYQKENNEMKQFDVNYSLESPEMVQERQNAQVETDKQEQKETQKQNAQTRADIKREREAESKALETDKQQQKQTQEENANERRERRADFRDKQYFSKESRAPTEGQYYQNEFNKYTRNLALGISEHRKQGRALGAPPSAEKSKPFTKSSDNINFPNAIVQVDAALMLITFFVKLWSKKDDDKNNNILAKQFVSQNLEIEPIQSYKDTTHLDFEKSKEKFAKKGEKSLKSADYIYPSYDSIRDYPSYNIPSDFENIYSQYDMGVPQEVDESELPALIEVEPTLDLENEDEEVKQLAIKYSAKTQEDIEKIKVIIKNREILKSNYTTTTTKTILPKKENNNGIIEYTPFRVTDVSEDSNLFPRTRGILNTLNKTSSNVNVLNRNKEKNRVGGTSNETVSLFKFFVNLIELRIYNNEIFVFVPDNITQNIINQLVMYNSITYLENIQYIQNVYNNNNSYQNINDFLLNFKTSLINFTLSKRGGKTKKIYRKQNKNTKKQNKKMKKYYKNTKKQLLRYSKNTKRNK